MNKLFWCSFTVANVLTTFLKVTPKRAGRNFMAWMYAFGWPR